MSKPIAAFHIHHDVLFEFLTEPIESRIAYIRANKAKREIELRLKLVKPVEVALLPPALVKARAAHDKALAAYEKPWAAYEKPWAAHDKARAALAKARAALAKALADHMPEIEALHARLCPNCPWDGKTIFAGRGEGD